MLRSPPVKVREPVRLYPRHARVTWITWGTSPYLRTDAAHQAGKEAAQQANDWKRQFLNERCDLCHHSDHSPQNLKRYTPVPAVPEQSAISFRAFVSIIS